MDQFANSTGLMGANGFIFADLNLDESTEDQRQAYATQASTDYYLWALSVTDVTFKGIAPINTTALDLCVEWCHTPDRIFTRIIRMPWSDRNLYGCAAPKISNHTTTCSPIPCNVGQCYWTYSSSTGIWTLQSSSCPTTSSPNNCPCDCFAPNFCPGSDSSIFLACGGAL